MALINSIGKSGSVEYGSQSVLTFSVRFMSDNDTSTIPFNTYQPMLKTNAPTVGTLIIAGTTVSLIAADLISPVTVARKIQSTVITGYRVGIDTYCPNCVKLQSTTYGPITVPTIALGTATNIIFYDIKFTQGSTITTPGVPVQMITFVGTAAGTASAIVIDGISTVSIANGQTASQVAATVASTSYAGATTSGQHWVTSVSGATVTFVGTYTATIPASIIVSYGTVSGITPAAGAIGMICLDDIFIGGKVPITLYIESVNVTAYIMASNDAGMSEQEINALSYSPPLALTTVNTIPNSITITAPSNYIRMGLTGVGGTSWAKLHIAR